MVTILSHPLVEHWLAELRSVETGPARFRELVRRLSAALFIEAARDLPLVETRIRTPLTEAPARRLRSEPVLAPILRAGIGMAEGVLDLVPEATVHHLGFYRQHDTLEAICYYRPTVSTAAGRPAFILDPMLATGGSAVSALEEVCRWGVVEPRLLCLIGAPEGVARVHQAYPDVPIYLGALDERLNELGYIVPGLGDAGDRQFNSP
jgi:uracil phosphoribosyltransferase